MDIFIAIGIIIVIATVISAVMKLLKQPLIIGYILTGLILSPYFADIAKSPDTLSTFAQIGVAFLLFLVGLNLSPSVIKEVCKASLAVGLGQIVFTAIIGFFICNLLGFSDIVSLYIAIALTFSSTIIVLKLLSDKNDLEKLYGKISIGVLIIQDIAAIIALILISSFASKGNSILNMAGETLVKGVFLISFLMLVSKYVLPKLEKSFFAKSQEFLFLFSLGWGLGSAALFYNFGLSIEAGALIAGVALSISKYQYEISSKLRPIRDFFIILFFIMLGSQAVLKDLVPLIIPALVLSAFVLLGTPIITMALMGFSGYNKKTSLLTGLTLAQISEFSLVLIALGVKVGHLKPEILSLTTLIGLLTIAGSTYFILYGDKIYKHLEKYLSIFEGKYARKEEERRIQYNYDIILFGYNRIGHNFLEAFKKLKKKFLIVDYNPVVIESLSKKKIDCLYGDADDLDLLNRLNLKQAKMIISTIPKFETNSLLIKKTKRANPKMIIIVVSHSIEEAMALYKKGAAYVIMPHFLGGSYASMMLDKNKLSLNKFLKEKELHIKHLKTRKEIGQEHPLIEKNK